MSSKWEAPKSFTAILVKWYHAMKLKKSIFLFLVLMAATSLSAQTVLLTQIDSGQLLGGQKNRVWAHLLDSKGNPVQQPDAGQVKVSESADGQNFVPVGNVHLTVDSNKTQGIAFLFLMDNSGSMYDTLEGKKTDDPSKTRYYAANKAASDFLLSVSGPADTVGLAVFNTRYQLLVAPVADRQSVAGALDKIARPARDDSYTELYASIRQASSDQRTVKGRKALVVLSDGANYSYVQYKKEPNPQFGQTVYQPSDALEQAVRDGWTVFAVNFGPDPKDQALADIAKQSGGEVFDAGNQAELTAIYRTIRDKILTEVLVEYSASMLPGDKRWVKVDYTAEGNTAASTRFYYVGTVFGQAQAGLPWWVFLLLPLALLAWLVLSLLKFDKPSLSANLSLLYAPGVGKGTRIFPMGNQTIIGGDKTADVTIAGNQQLMKSPVTITKDTITGHFTLLSSTNVTVNNKSVTTKVLEPGDVINFNGTIVVFDDQEAEAPKAPKAKKSATKKKKV